MLNSWNGITYSSKELAHSSFILTILIIFHIFQLHLKMSHLQYQPHSQSQRKDYASGLPTPYDNSSLLASFATSRDHRLSKMTSDKLTHLSEHFRHGWWALWPSSSLCSSAQLASFSVVQKAPKPPPLHSQGPRKLVATLETGTVYSKTKDNQFSPDFTFLTC